MSLGARHPTVRPALGLVLAMGLLALGGCSYASIPLAGKDAFHKVADLNEREAACERARANMIAAPDPIEARQWELYMEDLDCPSLWDR